MERLFPRPYLLETSDEYLDAAHAAINVQTFQNAPSALPLMGERAGVRADQSSKHFESFSNHPNQSESQPDSVSQPKVGAQQLLLDGRGLIERPPSPQPECDLFFTETSSAAPGEGARWAGLELFVSCSPRPHLQETRGECLEATNAAISVQVFQNAPSAPPLLGERAGVRVDHSLASTTPHRPRIIRQRMRSAFLKLTKDSDTNHLRCASQPRVPEPEFLDAQRCEKLGPLLVMLALLRKAVLRSVEFNGEPGFLAKEIQRVGPGRVLSPELVSAELAISQPAPQNLFRPSRVLAKRSGFVRHAVSLRQCAEVRKNRVTPALTPALSPRRGGATGAHREMVAPSSAFSSSRFTCRTPVGGERGDRRASFQEHPIRVPSPGGEGQGEGGPFLTNLDLL